MPIVNIILAETWRIITAATLLTGSVATFIVLLNKATWRNRVEILGYMGEEDLTPENIDESMSIVFSWTWRETLREWAFKAALGTLGILVIAAAGYVAIDAITATAPTPSSPNFADQIIASSAVLAAVRLALIFAAAYVIASVTVRMYRNQWLVKAGPFEVAEDMAKFTRAQTSLELLVADQEETIESLEAELENLSQILNNVSKHAKEDS